VFVGAFQPCLFPEQQAGGLAVAVEAAIATRSLEMNGPSHPSVASLRHGVACLVCDLVNAELSATKRKHLGLKRQILETSALIQSRKDFLLTSDNDPVACVQSEFCRIRSPH
jgi:hypothetical protein